MQHALTSLFHAQTYTDAWSDYRRALVNPNFPVWDYIILTASNAHQTEGFEAQLKQRSFPARTRVAVLPDPDGKRVGSGGATLGVIRYIKEREAALGHDAGGRPAPSQGAVGASAANQATAATPQADAPQTHAAARQTAPQTAPQTPLLDLVTLRAFVAERSTPENRAKIKAILTRYGVRKLTELKESQYEAVRNEVAAL